MATTRNSILFLALSTFLTISALAHPMPNSMVILKIHEKNISGEIQLPLGELQSAIGMKVNDNSTKLVERLGDSLRIYLSKHIRPKTFDGKPWALALGQMKVIETKSKLTGDYKELVVEFSMTPPPFYDLRNFYFDYDVILHQVASHNILVNVKQDWQQGIVAEDSTLQQIGVISLDVRSGKIPVFQVSLQQGSNWNGFKNMVSLGISHIKEGTDHILFLLTLLLASINPFTFGNVTSSKLNLNSEKSFSSSIGGGGGWILLKLVTAFTIGHSLTLLLGSVKWLNFPSKPIEILIAITILISAVHAVRPIYPKKEIWIAGGFGLIHGLAFAETLTNLQLSTKQLILSIFGFNIGIELMQLVVILATIPWLILLSKTSFYFTYRTIAAAFAAVAAFGWLVERFTEKTNFITTIAAKISDQYLWFLIAFAVLSTIAYYFEKNRVEIKTKF